VLQRIVVVSLGCLLLSSVLSEGDFVDDTIDSSSGNRPIEASIISSQEDSLSVIDPPVTTPPSITPEPVYALQIEWQNWTDLLLNNEPNLSEYTCDPDKTECRVNLLVIPLLDGVVSSDLTCEVTADFELVPTQDSPCNLHTSIVPKGDHTLSIKILKKSDGTLVTHKDILLKNPLIDTSLDPLRVTSTITWQSPTDLNTKDDTSLAEYICD